MTNLAIELLLLIIVLVNFGTILTSKIYSQSVKEIQRKRLFCSESISNTYCPPVLISGLSIGFVMPHRYSGAMLLRSFGAQTCWRFS